MSRPDPTFALVIVEGNPRRAVISFGQFRKKRKDHSDEYCRDKHFPIGDTYAVEDAFIRVYVSWLDSVLLTRVWAGMVSEALVELNGFTVTGENQKHRRNRDEDGEGCKTAEMFENGPNGHNGKYYLNLSTNHQAVFALARYPKGVYDVRIIWKAVIQKAFFAA